MVALPLGGTFNPPSCGGSLITPEVVLTSASCAGTQTASSYVGQPVHVGAYQVPFTSDGSQVAFVSQQLISPNFVGTASDNKNDFMLLRLASPVNVEVEDLMRLSNYVEDMEPGINLRTAGFGSAGTIFPIFLQEAMQQVWFDGDCEIVYESQTPPTNVEASTELCAGGRNTMEPSVVSDQHQIPVGKCKYSSANLTLTTGRCWKPSFYSKWRLLLSGWNLFLG
jgi:Trypsin